MGLKKLVTGSLNKDLGILLLRLSFGGSMMLAHGLGKLSRGPGEFPDPLGIGNMGSWVGAVGAEFFCSLALMLGLAQRAVLVPLMFTMFVAIFVVHGDDPYQKKELALAYLAAYAALFFTGAGKYSADAFLGKAERGVDA